MTETKVTPDDVLRFREKVEQIKNFLLLIRRLPDPPRTRPFRQSRRRRRLADEISIIICERIDMKVSVGVQLTFTPLLGDVSKYFSVEIEAIEDVPINDEDWETCDDDDE